MLDALNAVFAAVGTGTIVPVHAYVLCKEGRILATNGWLTADMPCDAAADMNVLLQADALKRALSLPDARVPAMQGERLVIRHGRRGRASLRALPQDIFPEPAPMVDGVDYVLEDGEHFKNTLTRLLPFKGDGALHPWASGIYFDGEGYAMATNNLALAVMKSTFPCKLLLPAWAITFLLTMDPPDRLCLTEGRVQFTWEQTGMVVTSSLLADPFSESAIGMANAAIEHRGRYVEVPAEWREAAMRMTEFGISKLRIGPEKLRGDNDDIALREDVGLPVPERNWAAGLLAAMLPEATHIDLSCETRVLGYWRGDDIWGLFAGRSD